MSEAPSAKDRQLAQVAGRATSLADRILDAQIAGRAIPPEQITSLAGAAQLLQDHGMDWPPLVEQVLHDFADRLDRVEDAPEPGPEPEGDDVATGLKRFFAAFRREKGLAAQP